MRGEKTKTPIPHFQTHLSPAKRAELTTRSTRTLSTFLSQAKIHALQPSQPGSKILKTDSERLINAYQKSSDNLLPHSANSKPPTFNLQHANHPQLYHHSSLTNGSEERGSPGRLPPAWLSWLRVVPTHQRRTSPT